MGAQKETLRQEQKRLARERIVDAAAAAIAEHGLADLSVPAVAEAAGVSLRTVYNYFESKDALLRGLGEVARERVTAMGAIDQAPEMSRIGPAVRTNWPLFAALGTLGDAWSVVRISGALARGQSSIGSANTDIDVAMRTWLAEELGADLDEAQREALFVLLRGIVASEAFYRMRQYGVAADEAAEVSAWAFEVLNRALLSGDRPFGGAPGTAEPVGGDLVG